MVFPDVVTQQGNLDLEVRFGLKKGGIERLDTYWRFVGSMNGNLPLAKLGKGELNIPPCMGQKTGMNHFVETTVDFVDETWVSTRHMSWRLFALQKCYIHKSELRRA